MQSTTQLHSNQTLSRSFLFSALFAIFINMAGCSSAIIEPERIEIKNPGPKVQTFEGSFNDVWRASLIVLGKYPLKSYDEESGVIETDYIKGDEAFVAAHKKKYVPGGYRYKLNLRVIKSKAESNSKVKVVLLKQAELQRDFFAEPEKIQSDGLEEISLLYRIERELALEKALSKVKRSN